MRRGSERRSIVACPSSPMPSKCSLCERWRGEIDRYDADTRPLQRDRILYYPDSPDERLIRPPQRQLRRRLLRPATVGSPGSRQSPGGRSMKAACRGIWGRKSASGRTSPVASQRDAVWRRFSTSGRWRRTERRDDTENLPEQSARHRDLGHLECDRPAVPRDLGADLHKPVAQRGHRPLPHHLGLTSRSGTSAFVPPGRSSAMGRLRSKADARFGWNPVLRPCACQRRGSAHARHSEPRSDQPQTGHSA